MAYITVMDLPEKNKLDLNNDDYLLVSEPDESFKVKLSVINDFLSGIAASEFDEIKNKVIDDISNFVHANAVQFAVVSTENIQKGQPVQISTGEDPNKIYVENATVGDILGIAEFDIPSGQTSTILVNGILQNVNTQMYNLGDKLYFNNGTYITDKSFAEENELTKIGFVLADGIDGKILIDIEKTQTTTISIYDENNLIGTTNKINFIGEDVNSFVNNETGAIDVYIPSASISSKFNNNIDSTDAILRASFQTYDRILSDVDDNFFTSTFKTDDTVPTVINDLTFYTNESFYVSTNNTFTVSVLQGTAVQENSITIDSNGIFTNENITITVIDFKQELNHFSAKINILIKLNNHGENAIHVNYTDANDDISYNNLVFYDDSSVIPKIYSDTELTYNTYKYLSGIKFGSSAAITSDLRLVNAKYLTYENKLLRINGNNIINTKDINITPTDKLYNTDIMYSLSENILSDRFIFGVNEESTAFVYDFINSNNTSLIIDGLIDTNISNSNRIYEDFITEDYRLRSDSTSPLYLLPFDSTRYLDDSELQVYNDRLVYPTLDFSMYFNNYNYSTLTGNRSFIRKFWHSGISHSNGIFKFDDTNITEEDLGDTVLLEISLNGNTWFDITSDYFGGVIADMGGARINSDINNLEINNLVEFTLGLDTFTDIDSDWGIYFRITLTDPQKYVGTIQLINWN